MASLPTLVRQAVKRFALCREGETVLVAFSGGPDSTALLHVLAGMRGELGIDLVAAHLDHAQRPDSDEDLRYCQRVARRLGLPVLTGALPPGRRSEERLRELRYQFLTDQAAMVGADSVATGHTLSDRAETFLLNLVRGSGTLGLAGLPPATKKADTRIIRPLYLARRADILDYLARGRHRHLEDPTNRDLAMDRNRIRHEVLPTLERIRPGSEGAIARACDLLAADADFLASHAAKILHRRAPETGAPCPGLHRLHPALGRMVLRELIRAARGDLRGVTLAMIDGTLELAGQAAADGRVRRMPLRGPWVAEASRRGVRILQGHRGRPGA